MAVARRVWPVVGLGQWHGQLDEGLVWKHAAVDPDPRVHRRTRLLRHGMLEGASYAQRLRKIEGAGRDPAQPENPSAQRTICVALHQGRVDQRTTCAAPVALMTAFGAKRHCPSGVEISRSMIRPSLAVSLDTRLLFRTVIRGSHSIQLAVML